MSEIGSSRILSYAISNEEGYYSLTVTSERDSLQIKVSHLGYKEVTRTIANSNQTENFTLAESSVPLKEVVVKSIPIEKRSDTITYSVSAFKDQKDRVIADVLKKLPGIEVLENGKILYQGKAIQKYYIEGLDLLEGKYNLANNNLPANSVSKVQILENHQPIKLLDSTVFSNRTSLNIDLKNDIAVTGTAKLGAGFSPFLWDVNVTPMLFAKKLQMISSYQANNSGNDISTEVKVLTAEEFLDQFGNTDDKQNWLGIQELSSPPFSEDYWLDNNAHLLTTNFLTRLKKDFDLKVNLSYTNDVQEQVGSTETSFFTPEGTVTISESTENRLLYNFLKSNFILEKNTKKSYLKNNFQIKTYWDSQDGLAILNNQGIEQNAELPFTSLNNKLKWIQPIGKRLVTIKSILTYNKAPQDLMIAPGQFQELLNNGEPFDVLNQEIDHSLFYSNTSLSFIHGYNNFTFTPKVGFSHQNEQLDSRILANDNIVESTTFDSFQNELRFNQSSLDFVLNTQYRSKKFKIDLDTPFRLRAFDTSDDLVGGNQSVTRFVFEPRLSVKKEINAFWEASVSTGYSKRFGDINQLYGGYILTNYRNIERYQAPILERSTSTTGLGVSYRNTLKSLFLSGFYSFANTNQNLLWERFVNSNGSSTVGFQEQDNTNRSHILNVRGSKFLSKLKTTVTLSTYLSLNDKEQNLNDVLTDVQTKGIELNGKVNTELTDWMSFKYEAKFSITDTEFNNQSLDDIKIHDHVANFIFYPNSSNYIGFDVNYYWNNLASENQENYFLNLIYRYTLKKHRIDFELKWSNILNYDEFTQVSSDALLYERSVYQLRPSQLLCTVRFGL